jgi:hypothetical protein
MIHRVPDALPIDLLSEAARDTLREVGEAVMASDPERESAGVEVWIRQTELAIWTYRDPEAARAATADDTFSAEVAIELEALARAARSLSQRIEALGVGSRRALTASGAMDEAVLDRLHLLAGVASAACGDAARAGAEGDVEAATLEPDVALVEQLAGVWREHTGQPFEEDRAGRSPFARYVETACGVVGLDSEHAGRLRVRVSRTMSLLESAEMLATLPEGGDG